MMKVSRKDTIIFAVLINLALLSVLFLMAVGDDSTPAPQKEEMVVAPADLAPQTSQEAIVIVEQPLESSESKDEVDLALQSYQEQQKVAQQDPSTLSIPEAPPLSPPEEPKSDYVKVSVKKGDSLDKIARQNHTTVAKLKQINHLNRDLLSVGQVLLVPKEGAMASVPAASPKKGSSEPVYYVLKNGDNPWKISRKLQIPYNSILQLNHLTEESARNLKVGDTIRIK